MTSITKTMLIFVGGAVAFGAVFHFFRPDFIPSALFVAITSTMNALEEI